LSAGKSVAPARTEIPRSHRRLRAALAVAAALLPIPAGLALVSLEDGKDHIFADGSIEMGYDSNVFANSVANASVTYKGDLSIEFVRRAGWIGVNGSASVDWMRYEAFQQQDYVDPKFTLGFTKQTGRTTGSLTFTAQREDRADVTVNTRDRSWDYDADFTFQYPVIERYSISGSLEYDRTDYINEPFFVNQLMYTGNLYLYYILNEQRDFFVDYRNRYTDEADGTRDLDNELSAGVSGRVYGPFNGSFQVGYQNRNIRGGVDGGNGFNDLSVSGTATWNMDRRKTLTVDAMRDFTTAPTGESLETTSANLVFQDSLTAKASYNLTAGGGENKFLGQQGIAVPEQARRVDYFYDLSAAYFYTVNQHLKLSLVYTYYRSYSTISIADFPRHQLDFMLSSHW
jgi:hypothetical protein